MLVIDSPAPAVVIRLSGCVRLDGFAGITLSRSDDGPVAKESVAEADERLVQGFAKQFVAEAGSINVKIGSEFS